MDEQRRSDNVIAEGEATGHYHAVVGSGVSVFGGGADRKFEAPLGAVLEHQEHGHVKVVPGLYDTGTVREMDHFLQEARRVVD